MYVTLEPKREVGAGNRDGRLLVSILSAQCRLEAERVGENSKNEILGGGLGVSSRARAGKKERGRVGSLRCQGENGHKKEGPVAEMSGNWGRILDSTRMRVLVVLTN